MNILKIDFFSFFIFKSFYLLLMSVKIKLNASVLFSDKSNILRTSDIEGA
jgi:hypothetical protein